MKYSKSMSPAEVVVKSGLVASVAFGTWFDASAAVDCRPMFYGILILQPAGGTKPAFATPSQPILTCPLPSV